MATNFPTSLDTLTNPNSTDTLNSPSHATQHANANDAIEALEAKVGADGSAVTTSHDYKLSEVTSTDKAVGKTATQTLTNKTIDSASNTIQNIATGDLASPTGVDTNVVTGTAGTSGNLAEWNADGDAVDSSLATADVVTGSSTDTLTNKTIDANGTGNSISNLEVADFAGSAIVTEGEGLASSDNDTSIPTTAAVKDYADNLSASTVIGSGAVTTFTDQPSKQALFTQSISANTLGTSNAIKFTVIADIDEASADTFTVTYGSTDILTIDTGDSTDGTWVLEGYLMANGATGSQRAYAKLSKDTGVDTVETEFGSSSEDSTGALNFVVSFTGGSANTDCTGGRYIIERVA